MMMPLFQSRFKKKLSPTDCILTVPRHKLRRLIHNRPDVWGRLDDAQRRRVRVDSRLHFQKNSARIPAAGLPRVLAGDDGDRGGSSGICVFRGDWHRVCAQRNRVECAEKERAEFLLSLCCCRRHTGRKEKSDRRSNVESSLFSIGGDSVKEQCLGAHSLSRNCCLRSLYLHPTVLRKVCSPAVKTAQEK